MDDGTQEERIDSAESRECLSVGPVRLAQAVCDEPNLTWIRNDHLVSQTGE